MPKVRLYSYPEPVAAKSEVTRILEIFKWVFCLSFMHSWPSVTKFGL